MGLKREREFYMYRCKVWFEIAARCVLTLCLTLALCMDMGIPSMPDAGTAGYMVRIWSAAGLTATHRLITPLFFVLLWIAWKIDEQKAERRISFPIVSGFIALIWLMGEAFQVDNTLWTLHASYAQIVKSFIYFVGITYGINQITYFLYDALEKTAVKSLEGPLTDQRTLRSRTVRAYREHTALVSFGAVFVLWLPHLILSYPANPYPDTYVQLSQAFGLYGYSSGNPIISTLIMGGLVKAGSLISGNFGLFLYIAVQAIIAAWILACTLCLMRELNTPVWLRIFAFGCYVFVPYYTGYIGSFLKDVPYSYVTLLFVTELIYLLVRNEDFFRSRKHIILLAASTAGSILLRKNGRYIIYPTIAVVVLFFFFRKRKAETGPKGRRRVLYPAMAVLLIPALLAEIFIASIMIFLNVEHGSIREAFSLPMQQTARYVKELGDEVTEEERAAISAVLDYENLAETYDPLIADPVKWLFKYSPTTEELRDYLSVWLKQFTKHPFVYFKATVNQNYPLLYPYIYDAVYHTSHVASSAEGDWRKELAEFLELSDVEPIASLKKPWLGIFYSAASHIPGLNILSNLSFYMISLIWLTLFAFCRKRFLWLLASIPLWLSAAIIVLSPVIQENPRYAFPIIYAFPVILAYYVYLGGSVGEKVSAFAGPGDEWGSVQPGKQNH